MNENLMLRVREVTARHFGMSIECLKDDLCLRNDLGADKYDCIELMIAIEDQVVGIKFSDAAVDKIENIGDLMRFVVTFNPNEERTEKTV
jgi:acyl carrier protein